MSLPVRLLPEAKAEFDDSADWYNRQRKGLGRTFVAHIRDTIARIRANPRLHAVVYQDVRKAVVPQFPFVVLYKLEPGEVVVVAVFHTARDPLEWQRRA
jgi:toxin ParE1/3/4